MNIKIAWENRILVSDINHGDLLNQEAQMIVRQVLDTFKPCRIDVDIRRYSELRLTEGIMELMIEGWNEDDICFLDNGKRLGAGLPVRILNDVERALILRGESE